MSFYSSVTEVLTGCEMAERQRLREVAGEAPSFLGACRKQDSRAAPGWPCTKLFMGMVVHLVKGTQNNQPRGFWVCLRLI